MCETHTRPHGVRDRFFRLFQVIVFVSWLTNSLPIDPLSSSSRQPLSTKTALINPLPRMFQQLDDHDRSKDGVNFGFILDR